MQTDDHGMGTLSFVRAVDSSLDTLRINRVLYLIGSHNLYLLATPVEVDNAENFQLFLVSW